MDTKCEDTYFLDRDLAYQTALEHNTVILKDGQKTIQVCYYDGQAFGHAPDNLIHVPAESITQFFSQHDMRVPTRVESQVVNIEISSEKMQQRLIAILTAVKQLTVNPR